MNNLDLNENLSKRLIISKKWRWLPGMLTIDGWRIISINSDSILTINNVGSVKLFDCSELYHKTYFVLDLTDPATLGCLTSLVRDAWIMPTGIIVKYSDHDGLWGVSWSGATHGGWCGRGRTEAEALVVALENA